MKNNSVKIIILFLLVVLFITFCILTILTMMLKNENENTINYNNIIGSNNLSNTVDSQEKTIKNVVESHGSIYISDESSSLYVGFAKNLYDENGKSNEEFFKDLAEELIPYFNNESFYMIDEGKDINIYVQVLENDFELIINDMKDFYEVIDGRDFIAVENSKIVEASQMYENNGYLTRLSINNMYFSYIEKYLTNGRELDNGYTVYVDQQVKVKLAPNKAVFNIVFLEDYKDDILLDVSLNDRLSEISEKHNDFTFGGLDKGYLGYRSGDYYYFFYENQASVYPYIYSENTKFERYLTEYIETKDLDKFVKNIITNIKSYSDYEYDSDIKKAYIAFPTRGIKIDIKDNDSKGIVLYSNYYLTDTTKQLVKEGKIQYSKNDFVNEYEQMRKEAE